MERNEKEKAKKRRNEKKLPGFRGRFDKLRNGRSNTEFADYLDISRQTIGFYLNGNRLPDAESIVKICTKCGCSADWLLGLSGVPSRVECLVSRAMDIRQSTARLANERTVTGMDDYISRETALDMFDIASCEEELLSLIKKLPPADVEPKRKPGRWIRDDFVEGRMTASSCSECGLRTFGRTNFCPNCGAKMDGGDHDG